MCLYRRLSLLRRSRRRERIWRQAGGSGDFETSDHKMKFTSTPPSYRLFWGNFYCLIKPPHLQFHHSTDRSTAAEYQGLCAFVPWLDFPYKYFLHNPRFLYSIPKILHFPARTPDAFPSARPILPVAVFPIGLTEG